MKLGWRKIVTDPTFWILLVVNACLVYKYEQTPYIFTTLIWLYYSQNMLCGLFNFLDMITSKNVDVSTLKVNGNKDRSDGFLVVSYAWGFLMFFGFFHFVYFVFLLTMKKSGPFDWGLYKHFLIAFFAFQLFSFIRNKIQNREKAANIGRMAAVPFLRVVPMHLCILIPAFLDVSNLTVFLVLKVIADLITFIITTSYYRDNIVLTATGININSTISDF